MVGRAALRRPRARSASRSGSCSPAINASRIARPLTPRMSLTTVVSFRLASSRTFWSRSVCWAISRTSCLRVRVRSRSSWIGAGGTKLLRIRPCASRSAIQVASLTSLLRPGIWRRCIALASTSSNWPSRTCQTGFQKTPVDSIATWVIPRPASQSARASSSRVVVPNVRTSWVIAPATARRAQATTVFWCTSRPAHRGCIISMGASWSWQRRRGARVIEV